MKQQMKPKRLRLQNDLFTATFIMSPDAKRPHVGRYKTLLFLALSEPHHTFWDGDWWVECTEKRYKTEYFPDHRPVWMTYGEWEQLQETFKNYRLASMFQDRPLFITDEQWVEVMDVKARYGMLPSSSTPEDYDALEDQLDRELGA